MNIPWQLETVSTDWCGPVSKYRFDEFIVWVGADGHVSAAWRQNGLESIAYFHGKPIRKFKLTEITLDMLQTVCCNWCGAVIPDETMKRRHSFAGVLCPRCYEEYKMKLVEQRTLGFVCSMCGQPWSECAC